MTAAGRAQPIVLDRHGEAISTLVGGLLVPREVAVQTLARMPAGEMVSALGADPIDHRTFREHPMLHILADNLRRDAFEFSYFCFERIAARGKVIGDRGKRKN